MNARFKAIGKVNPEKNIIHLAIELPLNGIPTHDHAAALICQLSQIETEYLIHKSLSREDTSRSCIDGSDMQEMKYVSGLRVQDFICGRTLHKGNLSSSA